MTLKLYVFLICYIPIVDIFLPKTNFGEELPDIDATRLFSYFLVITFSLSRTIKRKPIFFNKWSINQFVFSIIVLLSLAWSQEPFDIHTISGIFDTVFTPLFILIISTNTFQKKENVDFFIKMICIAALILSAISLHMMLLSQHPEVQENDVFRSAGFGRLSNPNGLAIFLVMSIPCVLYGIKNKIINSMAGWIILFFIYAGVICTVSRKGISTMVLTSLLFFSLTGQIKKIIFTCIVAIIAAVMLSNSPNIAKRFKQKTIKNQLEGKANMAMAGVKMFVSSPIIGKGYRGYHNNWKEYFPFSGLKQYSAHNIFVTALANFGLVGFIPFMIIFLYPLHIAFKIRFQYPKTPENEHLQGMAAICISTVTCFMVSGYFAGGIFYDPEKMTLLYTIISFTLCAYEKDRGVNKTNATNDYKEAIEIEKHYRGDTQRRKQHIYRQGNPL